MDPITIDPNQLMDFIIKYGPYFGIYFLNQSLKSRFKIKGDQVFLLVFLTSCIVAFAQMVIEKAAFPPLEFGCWVFFRGLSLASASWLSWWVIKLVFKRKD
jgi:hypothetical protein